MGQMKKLYELTAEQDKPFLYFMHRTTQLTVACERVLELIRKSEFLIGDYLANAEYTPYEGQDIETVRGYLNQAIELLEGPHDHAQGTSQGQHRATQD